MRALWLSVGEIRGAGGTVEVATLVLSVVGLSLPADGMLVAPLSCVPSCPDLRSSRVVSTGRSSWASFLLERTVR
jgi:hypothetical protein